MIIILKHECIYIFSVLIYRLVYNHIYACNPLSNTCDGADQCQYATIICICYIDNAIHFITYADCHHHRK